MILFRQINASSVRVEASREVLLAINEKFTFFAPDYFFHPRFKAGIWDGRIHLFSLRTNLLPSGLLPATIDLVSSRGWNYMLQSDGSVDGKVKDKDVDVYMDSLVLPFKLDPSQRLAVKIFNENSRAVILSQTGSGKSIISYVTIRMLLDTNICKKILVVVPTKSLSEQMYTDFIDYSSERWVDDNVARIHSEVAQDWSKQITISTYQTLMKQSPNHFTQYDSVVIDEAHKAKAKSITYVLDSCINAYKRLGMTATVENRYLDKLQLEGLIGKIHSVSTSKELEERGRLAVPLLIGVEIKHQTPPPKTYPQEVSWLIGNDARNDFIANSVAGTSGNNLVLCNQLEHVRLLSEKLREKGVDAKEIIGEVPIDEREEIRASVGRDSNVTIVATYGTVALGCNIPYLNTVFFAIAYKSRVLMMQSIGRIRRAAEGKTTCKIIDFYDTYGKKKMYSKRHFDERLVMYMEDGMEAKFCSVTLRG